MSSSERLVDRMGTTNFRTVVRISGIALTIVAGGCFADSVVSGSPQADGDEDPDPNAWGSSGGPDGAETDGESDSGDPSGSTSDGSSTGSSRGWQRRLRLSFDPETQAIAPVLVDVPVLVRLTPERFDYDAVDENGLDLSFFGVDQETPLPYEVERWEPGGESVIWVKVPAVGGALNDHFWMYYSSEDEHGLRGADAVWQPDHVGVWHFASDPTGPIVDSTLHRLDGEADAGIETAPGMVGEGLKFDGENRVRVPHDDELSQSVTLTLEGWARTDEVTFARQRLIGKSDAYGLDCTERNGYNSRIIVFDEQGATLGAANAASPPVAGTWVYFAGTYDDGQNRIRLFIDGVEVTDRSLGGMLGMNGNSLELAEGVVGVADELRLSTSTRRAEWFAVQNRSVRDTLLDFGVEEHL